MHSCKGPVGSILLTFATNAAEFIEFDLKALAVDDFIPVLQRIPFQNLFRCCQFVDELRQLQGLLGHSTNNNKNI
jgi:hypothetical protein